MDSASVKALFEILSILKSSGKTIILTSHEVEYVKGLIDREIELKRSVEKSVKVAFS